MHTSAVTYIIAASSHDVLQDNFSAMTCAVAGGHTAVFQILRRKGAQLFSPGAVRERAMFIQGLQMSAFDVLQDATQWEQ